ncbi:MAG: hypothetical protein ACJ73D_04100 [Pyrinomonadaceae bacterium]
MLVHLVDAPAMPAITPAHRNNCLRTTRPADWHTFGYDACKAEEARRRQVVDLLTDDEIQVILHYWRIRDRI